VQEPIWIQDLAVAAIHNRLLAQFGGSEGVRDQGLLESALARPKNRFAYSEQPSSISELAAAYAFGICRNHPFVDGNKRTALAVAGAFLDRNGFLLTATQEDAYLTFLSLASGQISEEELSLWFERNVQLYSG
jgi:death on curing protein